MVNPEMTFKDIKYEIENRTTLEFDDMMLVKQLRGTHEFEDNERLMDNKEVDKGGTVYLYVKSEALDVTITDMDTLMSPITSPTSDIKPRYSISTRSLFE